MTSAAKVGGFMLIVLAILAFFIMKIEDLSFSRAGMQQVQAIFDSVAGLDEKSAVRVAGVRKGKVASISLTPEGRALVTLEVDNDVRLHQGATAKVANMGLLGEKYIELTTGNPSAPVLSADGDRPIMLGAGDQPASIDDVTTQVSDIANDVKAITASLRQALGGAEGAQRLEVIVDNVRQITDQVRLLIEVNRGNVTATAENLRAITENLRVQIPQIVASLDGAANSIGGTVGENREDLRVIVENLRGLSSDLKTTADNLNSITGQVRAGEGTVGKLLYNDEAHERLVGALTSVEGGVEELRSTLGRAGRIGLDLGINAEYQAGLSDDDVEGFSGSSRTGVLARIIPNPDNNRFYNIELVDVPRGEKTERIIETTITDPITGETRTTVTNQVKFERDFLISAQAGWQLDDLAVRVGLFESSGGVGADYDFNTRLRVTGEAYDFGKKRDDNPHLRLLGQYVIRKEKPNFPMVFVSAGVDNALNDTAYTFGGGIRWRDEDLKYLIGSIPLR
ncbi:MAG TPA: MlaD family protein [Thermoanaerobaculia bacterium]|nr:MlaD family protein [Thermoanaerobaculia bacterium]